MKFREYMLVLAVVAAGTGVSITARAADCDGSQTSSKWDVLGRVAQAGDCANTRLQDREQAWKDKQQNVEQGYQDRKDTLRQNTVGRWDNEKQNLTDDRDRVDQKIQNGRDRLDAIRNAPKNRLDKLRDAGSEERQRWDNLKSQTGSDVSSLFGGNGQNNQ